MSGRILTLLNTCLIILSIGLMSCGGSLHAGENEDSLKELKARLDALEKQNQELKKAIEKAGIRPGGDKAEPDPRSVQKIVDDYIKDKEEKKKKDDEAAKKKQEIEGFTVGDDT